MIIGIYADPHISYTSSILPLHCDNSNYTYRLQMIIDSYKWMYEEFKRNNVDIICNCGDTFDSHTVKAEEITALTECLKYSNGIPEIWITGNHDMYNCNFYSNSFVKYYDFIKIFDKPTKVNDVISVLPYRKYEDIDESELLNISNKVLISHIDLLGSHVRPEFSMSSGLDPKILSSVFDYSFNGHIHTGENLLPNVINVGSLVCNSFSDSNSYIPRILIYNTENNELRYINNTNSVIFRKKEFSSMTDCLDYVKSLDDKFKYCLRFIVPFEIKNEISDILKERKNIVSFRIISKIQTNSITSNNSINDINITNSSILNKFKDFLEDNSDSFKYPKSYYEKLLKMAEKRFIKENLNDN